MLVHFNFLVNPHFWYGVGWVGVVLACIFFNRLEPGMARLVAWIERMGKKDKKDDSPRT